MLRPARERVIEHGRRLCVVCDVSGSAHKAVCLNLYDELVSVH